MKGNPVRETLKKTAFRNSDCPLWEGGGGKTLLDITITSLLTICMFVKTSVYGGGGGEGLLKTPPFSPTHPSSSGSTLEVP